MLGSMASPVAPAPEPLEAVRQFVNTLDVESGDDQFGSAGAVRRWLADHDLDPGHPLTSGDVKRAVDLREALREALVANHDRRDVAADAHDVINASAARAELAIEFTVDRTWRTRSRARGVDGALGSLLGIVVDAMTDGTWARLKACGNDLCRWGYYDNSRARTAKWCSMQVCGNRVKQQAWRARHAAG
jgi:predicted RNA-binding Zn ribbon-like protein